MHVDDRDRLLSELVEDKLGHRARRNLDQSQKSESTTSHARDRLNVLTSDNGSNSFSSNRHADYDRGIGGHTCRKSDRLD